MFWKVLVAVIMPTAQVLVAFLAVTMYLHRDLSHGSIKLSKPVAMLCRIQVFYVSGMKPREWAAVHRKHHAFSDVEGDPHSPVIYGVRKVLFNTAGLYHDVIKHTNIVEEYASDLPPDGWDRAIFDRGLLGPVVALPLSQLVLMYLIFGLGWHLALVLGMWPFAVLFFLWGGGAINAIGHTAKVRDINVLDGRSHTNDFSKNLGWFYRWATLGEGNHHNHHLEPGSAKFTRHAIWDPGWCAISVLRWFRLAKVKRVYAF